LDRHRRADHVLRNAERITYARGTLLTALLDELDANERGSIHDVVPLSSYAGWETFWFTVLPHLEKWPSLAIRIADDLAAVGLEDQAMVCVTAVPVTQLRRALNERPERSSFIPPAWISDERMHA